MLNVPRFLQIRRLAVLAAAALLAGCGGTCNCGLPTVNATPPPGSALACNQGSNAIVLGPALAPFAVLAGSAVSNVGNTLVTFTPGAVTGGINDDLVGVWPGSSVTGFYPPGTDTDGPNAIYSATFNTNTAVPMAAQGALTTAYNTAAGRASTAIVAGDLSQDSVTGFPTGTFPAGVYTSRSTLGIMAGNVTLDGQGNPQSVFIFQVGTGLTTTANGTASGNVLLKNGASACNVYWQVGSSAVLGGATFYGDVFAFSSVTVNATQFFGRALAGGPSLGTGAVSIPVSGGSLIVNPGGQ